MSMIMTMTELSSKKAGSGGFPTARMVDPAVATAPRPSAAGRGGMRSWQLNQGQTLQLRGWLGHAWVTLEGDREDYVLGPGVDLAFTGPGLLVLEPLGEEVVYDWGRTE